VTAQLEDFATYLVRVRGRAKLTAKAYVADVAGYAEWCAAKDLALNSALTKPQVGLYLMERVTTDNKRHGEGISSRSAARAISALRAYAAYLVQQGELPEDPLRGLKPPKYGRALPQYMRSDELRAVITAFDAGTEPREMRNAALLHLVYAAGLRAAESAQLNVNSVDLAARFVRVKGKGSRERVVPFGEPARDALARYMAEGRPQLVRSGPPTQALWLNPSGKRLGIRSLCNILNEAVERAGELRHLSPHKLRHACATHLLEGGADIRLVQELLGHESLQTTQVYTQITATRLREVYDASHPRARLR
jgi:integrase/recombinase XerD